MVTANVYKPTVFLLGAAVNRPIQLPEDYVDVTTPRGSRWRLDYVLLSFPRTVAAGAQTSPELSFQILEARGETRSNAPVPAFQITGPISGNLRIWDVMLWGLVYEPGEVISIRVTGQVAGPIPATVSITLLGRQGWRRFL